MIVHNSTMDKIFALVDAWDRKRRLVITPEQMGVVSLDEVDRCHVIASVHRERPGLFLYFWGDSLVVSTHTLEFGDVEMAPPRFIEDAHGGTHVVARQGGDQLVPHRGSRPGESQMYQFLPDPSELRARDSPHAKYLRSERAREWVAYNQVALKKYAYEEFHESNKPKFMISTFLVWKKHDYRARENGPDMFDAMPHIRDLLLVYINADPNWTAVAQGEDVLVQPKDGRKVTKLMDFAREVD